MDIYVSSVLWSKCIDYALISHRVINPIKIRRVLFLSLMSKADETATTLFILSARSVVRSYIYEFPTPSIIDFVCLFKASNSYIFNHSSLNV